MFLGSMFIVSGQKNNSVSAQTCPLEVVVDRYDCLGVANSLGVCNPPVGPLERLTRSCSWNGSQCTSTEGVCSSNDSCVAVGPGAPCYCSYSKVGCGSIGAGTPTPGPGSDGCPAGQQLLFYNPPQYYCPNPSNCSGRIKQPEEVCCEGCTPSGGDKLTCERGYCGVPTGTPTPTITPIAYCQNIMAYNNNWVLLTNTQLMQTKAGDQLYYCVAGYANSGSFDMARFTINSVLYSNTSLLRPGTTTDYCQSYVVPQSVINFNISGEMHSTSLGWVQ